MRYRVAQNMVITVAKLKDGQKIYFTPGSEVEAPAENDYIQRLVRKNFLQPLAEPAPAPAPAKRGKGADWVAPVKATGEVSL